jgi:hypothetical protein
MACPWAKVKRVGDWRIKASTRGKSKGTVGERDTLWRVGNTRAREGMGNEPIVYLTSSDILAGELFGICYVRRCWVFCPMFYVS